jgi:hypothetical protein
MPKKSVTALKPIQRRIRGFHSGDYEGCGSFCSPPASLGSFFSFLFSSSLKFLLNADKILLDYTASNLRRQYFP